MLANAISSAVDRLYAAAPADGRTTALRAGAVERVRAVDDATQERYQDREARDQARQRQALTRGVRAVFEMAPGETRGVASPASAEGKADAPADPAADPQLEEAILRFIHQMFRSLGDAEPGAGNTPTTDAPAPVDTASVRPAAPNVSPLAAATPSRQALGARIGELAQRLAEEEGEAAAAGAAAPEAADAAGSLSDRPSGSRSVDPALSKAYADVVQALGGQMSGASLGRTSRMELVNLLQRLALAMQGTPPVDPGLPTRGGLLTARA
jgi:hypothetical protein